MRAATVAEAFALLDSESFHLAIIDVNLGGNDSYPVAEALARHDIPFVFSTGYGDHGDRADFDDRPVLRKPYARAALVTAFEELIADRPSPAAA